MLPKRSRSAALRPTPSPAGKMRPTNVPPVGPTRLTAGLRGSIAVAIICKTPTAGQSKTRLSPPLRPSECAEISACFIQDLSRTIDGLGRASAHGYAVYTPVGSEDALRPLLPEGFGLVLQGSGDLGERLLRGISDLLAKGYAGVILVNSDSPTLPAHILEAAVGALAAGDQMVIGPAMDGGYTLIGLTAPHARLFEDIQWSTEVVFERTMERAREIGLSAVVLPLWYDVDDARSYAMLEAELDGAAPDLAAPGLPAQDAPSTRRFVTARRTAARAGLLVADR